MVRPFFLAIAAALVWLPASPAYAVVDFAQLLANSNGSITIPAEGATLTTAVTVTAATTVTGPGALAISGDGKITVEALLTLQNFSITWIKTVPSGQYIKAVQVTGGGIVMDGMNVTLNVTPPWLPDPATVLTARFLYVEGSGSTVVVEDSSIVGTIVYGAGFIWVDNGDNYSTIRFARNVFEYLHSAIYITNGDGVEIVDNSFNRVSLGNIVTSASDNLLIAGNSLTRSGNGTAGDALTIVGGHDIRIVRNSVAGGSCYGMHIRGLAGATMYNVFIEDNIVTGGSTTAFYLFGLSNGPIEDLFLRRNIASFNAGWGLVTQYVELTVEHLEFLTNAGTNNWPQHIFLTGTNLQRWAFNRRGIPFGGGSVPPYVSYPFQ